MQHSINSGADAELDGVESSGFLPVHPVHLQHDQWGIRGGGEEACPNSMLEYWVCLDNPHNMVDCPVSRIINPPATSASYSPPPFTPNGSTINPINPTLSCPLIDTCSPTGLMCSPTRSSWDDLRSTSRSPECSARDPVSAAAHLHLLGESLSLIGHHLQQTDKIVSMSSGLSLLLDSLLCALAPLICLTTEIPELRSCTQHTLNSTLENIAYMMPGL